jgi:hypothetical protein
MATSSSYVTQSTSVRNGEQLGSDARQADADFQRPYKTRDFALTLAAQPQGMHSSDRFATGRVGSVFARWMIGSQALAT